MSGERGEAGPPDSPLRLLFLLLAGVLFVAGGWVASHFPANHDLAWYVHVAGRLLDGADLYTDVVDVNPPLVIYLTGVPVAVGRGLGLDGLAAYGGGVLLVAGLSLAATHRLLRRAAPGASSLGLRTLLLVLVFLLVGIPGVDLGQREHLAILGIVPYLVAAARPRDADLPPGLAVPLGVAGAIAFAVKPHLLLVLAAVEARRAWSRGATSLKRTELLAALGTLTAYGGWILVAETDYLRVARLAAAVYGDFVPVHGDLDLLRAWQAKAGIAALLAGALLPLSGWRRRLARLLAAALAAFGVAVAVQHKGWTYHWYPVVVAAGAVATLVGIEAAARVGGIAGIRPASGDAPEGGTAGRPLRRRLHAAVLVGLAAVLLAGSAWRARVAEARWRWMSRNAYRLPTLAPVVAERAGPEGSISTLSSNMQVAFPLVNLTGAGWASRFNALWFLPGLYERTPMGTEGFPYRRPEEMGAAERRLFDAVVTDFVEGRPELLVVDAAPPGGVLHGFRFLEYYGADPRFRRAMEGYRPVLTAGRYRVFGRVDRSGTAAAPPPTVDP